MMSSPSCSNPRWGRGFSLDFMQLSFYVRRIQEIIIRRQRSTSPGKKHFARAASERMYYFVFTTQSWLSSPAAVGRINPNLYQHYEKKRGTGPLQVTIFLSVFPLICTSFMGLRHTVAFAGHSSIHWVWHLFKLICRKEPGNDLPRAFLLLEMIQVFLSFLTPSFSSHKPDSKPTSLSLYFAGRGLKVQGQQNITSFKTMELFWLLHWITESRFRSPNQHWK